MGRAYASQGARKDKKEKEKEGNDPEEEENKEDARSKATFYHERR